MKVHVLSNRLLIVLHAHNTGKDRVELLTHKLLYVLRAADNVFELVSLQRVLARRDTIKAHNSQT